MNIDLQQSDKNAIDYQSSTQLNRQLNLQATEYFSSEFGFLKKIDKLSNMLLDRIIEEVKSNNISINEVKALLSELSFRKNNYFEILLNTVRNQTHNGQEGANITLNIQQDKLSPKAEKLIEEIKEITDEHRS